MREKSIPQKIADLVANECLNSEQIADFIKVKEDPEENIKHIRTYINRALTKDLITVMKKEGRLQYYIKPMDKRIKEIERTFVALEVRMNADLGIWMTSINADIKALKNQYAELEEKVSQMHEFLEIKFL